VYIQNIQNRTNARALCNFIGYTKGTHALHASILTGQSMIEVVQFRQCYIYCIQPAAWSGYSLMHCMHSPRRPYVSRLSS